VKRFEKSERGMSDIRRRLEKEMRRKISEEDRRK
jgi:hypothetical protein